MLSLLQKLLLLLPPEKAHYLSLHLLNSIAQSNYWHWVLPSVLTKPCKVMGISFPNPVGLAAGLDKNAEYLPGLAKLGFGFIEVGTITPRAQPGNPTPRLFRLLKDHSLINRMGFNNNGIDAMINHIKQSSFKGILGINIGKNKMTPENQAIQDYLVVMKQCYSLADYITLNISSPNTPGLRNLQRKDHLKHLLNAIKEQQALLEPQYHRYVPVAVKVSPDLNDDEIESIANTLLQFEIDGLIATNTTISRPNLHSRHSDQTGGLSGAALTDLSNQILAKFATQLKNKVALIGVGGILSAADAKIKFELGADLVQLYTGLIYRGPRLIHECVKSI